MQVIQISYLVGGIYDIFLGLGVILFRSMIISLFGQLEPNIPILADSLGLFLLAYGFLLIWESRNEQPNLQIGITSAFVRLAYASFVIYYLFFSTIEFLYIFLAFTDTITGLFILFEIIDFQKRVMVS